MKIAVHFSIGKTQQMQLRNTTVLHVTEAETTTNYCETETETKKTFLETTLVSRP